MLSGEVWKERSYFQEPPPPPPDGNCFVWGGGRPAVCALFPRIFPQDGGTSTLFTTASGPPRRVRALSYRESLSNHAKQNSIRGYMQYQQPIGAISSITSLEEEEGNTCLKLLYIYTKYLLLGISSWQLEESCVTEDQVYLEMRVYPAHRFLKCKDRENIWKLATVRCRALLDKEETGTLNQLTLELRDRLKRKHARKSLYPKRNSPSNE